jgi:hypothetical protein
MTAPQLIPAHHVGVLEKQHCFRQRCFGSMMMSKGTIGMCLWQAAMQLDGTACAELAGSLTGAHR